MRDKKLIQLYVTNICSSHCKTCGFWKNKEEDRTELQYNDIEKVLMAFPNADYVIGGGEAILHKDIEKILSLLQDRRTKYTLLSNCIWVGRLCSLVDQYQVPAVTVSFDGLEHDNIRGVPGNTDNIINFKEWCDFYGVSMKISYTYSKYNEDWFEEDMKYIEEKLGFNEIYFCLAQGMKLLMTAEVDESFVAKDFEQIIKCDLIPVKDRNHIWTMISGVRSCCTSQNNVHTIYSNGDIVRCQSFMSKDILGNIKDMSVEEIRYVLNSVDNIRCQFDADCDLLCQRRYD